jgi:hypothetical protein
MKYFTHFKNGLYVKESLMREEEYYAGEFSDIFDDGLVVVSLDVCQIKDVLQDGEVLRSLNVSQKEIERTWESLPY